LNAGRIPVYFDEIEPLDTVLSHTIAYMNQTTADAAYRSRFLIPAAFIFFKGQYGSTSNIDGADEARWFIRNYVENHPGFTYTTLFEQEGYAKSYPSDLPLTEDNIVAEWSKGYGNVFWYAHGSPALTARMVWSNDDDKDDIAQESEISSPNFFVTKDAARITAGRPAFNVAFSCEVGSADTPSNIPYALLFNGASVGVVAASSPASGSATDYSDPSNPMDTTGFAIDNAGALVFDALMNGGYASQALYRAKQELGTSGSIETYANRMMTNYFGDPSLRLVSTVEEVVAPPDGGSADGGSAPESQGCSCSAVSVANSPVSM
ncbi:MAG: C25 family cysteine peptidase, partial [Myxococcota bacterium]